MASGDTLVVFTPFMSESTSTAAATFDTRNMHPVLDFDASASENTMFSSVMPQAYAAGGITAYISWAMTSATSSCVAWAGAWERIGDGLLDIDADSFAGATSGLFTVAGTAGCVIIDSLAFSNGSEMDSVATGEGFRFKFSRIAGSDGATGDAELRFLELRET